MALFTRETAREYAKRGNDAKAAIAAHRREVAGEPARLAVEPTFPSILRGRVRGVINNSLTRLEEESYRQNADGQRIRYLAGALRDLAELERVLDGRPMPGTLRPTAKAPPAAPRAPASPILPTSGASSPTAALEQQEDPSINYGGE